MFEALVGPRGVPSETQLLVVGAGPVGLTAAALFAQAGASVEVVEEDFAAPAQSDEVLLEPSVLSVLEAVGVLQELEESGQEVEGACSRQSGEAGRVSRFAPEGNAQRGGLVVARGRLKDLLAEELLKCDVAIRYGHRVRGVEQRDTSCHVTLDRLDDVGAGIALETREAVVRDSVDLEADIVLGADGHASAVRRGMHIDYARIGDDKVSLVAEFSGPERAEPLVRVDRRERGTDVLWPLGAGRYRLLRSVDAGEAERRLALHADGGEALVARKVPARLLEDWLADCPLREELELRSPIGAHAVRFHPSCARAVAKGSVALAGAAAHLFHPALGISDNLGILEANLLAQLARQNGDVLSVSQREYTLACHDLLSRAVGWTTPLQSTLVA